MENKGPFQVLSSEQVYRNPWISVREDKVIRPGGNEGLFGVIEMQTGSTVLAIDEEKMVYLVKEYKYGIEKDSMELMSGAIEEGESPLDAAKRELEEELGIEAKEWVDFGLVNPFTTIVNSPNFMFLAMGISKSKQNLDEGEVLEIEKVSFSEAVKMVMKSEITHAASCVLILKANEYLRNRKNVS